MRYRNRLTLAASLAAALALTVSACGSDDDDDGGSGDDGDVAAQLRETLDCDQSLTPEEVVDYEMPEPNEDYDITLMEVSLAGYYYQAIKEGAEELAPDGVSVTTVAGEGYVSPEGQLSQVDDAVQRGTDAIVMAPSDIEGSVPVVELAREADIPVVNISTEVNSDDVYMVMQDDYILGQQLADRVAETVPEGGRGILIAGPANATWSRKRTQGFTDQVEEEYPEIEVVASPTQLVDPAEGLASFEDAVQADPDIDWVASVHYFILLPSSIPAQYRGEVPYVGFGYEPDSIQALEKKELNSVYGIAPVAMGEIGVGTAISVLNGDEPPRITCVPSSLFTVDDIGTPVADSELAPSSQ